MTAADVERSPDSAGEPGTDDGENNPRTQASTTAEDAFRRLSNVQPVSRGSKTDAQEIKIGAPEETEGEQPVDSPRISQPAPTPPPEPTAK